jgi:hypothetical protein
MPPILIDTNLLIYLYDPNQPDKQKQSELVLEQLELTRNHQQQFKASVDQFS